MNAVGYQEMLHGELLPLITEIEDEKAPSQKDGFKISGYNYYYNHYSVLIRS